MACTLSPQGKTTTQNTHHTYKINLHNYSYQVHVSRD